MKHPAETNPQTENIIVQQKMERTALRGVECLWGNDIFENRKRLRLCKGQESLNTTGLYT